MIPRIFSSIRARLQPGYRSPYYREPRRYWERRHRHAGESLEGVGLQGLGPTGNAEDYEEKWRQIRHILKDLAADKSASLLDAGCGIGWFSSRAADMGFNVEGVDFSAEAIRTARQNVGPAVQWHVSELADFQSGRSYEIVMCIDVLFHIVDDRVWDESVRNLGALASDYLLIQEELTDQRKPLADFSRTHLRRRVKQDYLDALQGFELAAHHQYLLPAQETSKDILVFRRT